MNRITLTSSRKTPVRIVKIDAELWEIVDAATDEVKVSIMRDYNGRQYCERVCVARGFSVVAVEV